MSGTEIAVICVIGAVVLAGLLSQVLRGRAAGNCKGCGRQLAPSARWCPDCGTPLGRSVPCRSCGKQISFWGRRCHHCGAWGSAAYGPITFVIFGVLVLVMLGVFLLLAVFRSRP